ncbi:MAG: zinc ribbon domain-containing protein [Bacteroidota bacterium]|nr:zinc ribbon domain-containing protein [Bacteroidota bacterium]
MPYCPKCSYEYVEGSTICPDCNYTLLAGEPYACFNCEELLIEKHIFCPHCGYLQSEFLADEDEIMCETHTEGQALGCCVICGKAVCTDCSVEHQNRIFCSQDEHVKISEDWAVVFTTNIEYEAEMVRANLEGANIPCMVFSQRDHALGLVIGDMAVVKVMVYKKNLGEAEEYLKKIDLFSEDSDEE